MNPLLRNIYVDLVKGIKKRERSSALGREGLLGNLLRDHWGTPSTAPRRYAREPPTPGPRCLSSQAVSPSASALTSPAHLSAGPETFAWWQIEPVISLFDLQ